MVIGSAGAAEAAADWTPGSYPATAVPDTATLHLANRFSYGATPALIAEMKAAGGWMAWFDKQLASAYDGAATNLADWWPDLQRSPASLYQRQASSTRSGYAVMVDYVNRTMTRRLISPRPVLEVMTDFWENHLHVPANGELPFIWRASYGEMIRAGALGRFDDLLVAAISHPAMQLYLNGVGSTKAHPNENLARELLELHTMGVGTFTESDVKATARLLTGWIMSPTTGLLSFASERHSTGLISILGFVDDNLSTDGRVAQEKLLRYLAVQPATAQRIARKLVVRFVRDDAPADLVARLAKVYLDNGTAIQPVIRALVASPEFAASAGLKLRDPGEDVLASMRLLRATVTAPTSTTSIANLLGYGARDLGLAPLTWPAPNGAPQVNSAWATASRASASLQLHARLVSGTYPTAGVIAPAKSWLPALPLAFRDLVDHLHRSMHLRPSTSTALQACCEATGLTPITPVSTTHPVLTTGWPALLGALLDLPAFYQR
ncbi:unannotated protein [freshwater metagenome]|uniref:Unannotated protein n=1 Tax=freshwater metagenome TaxID=449393 RepID=A0A6J6RM10_9ZZZZ